MFTFSQIFEVEFFFSASATLNSTPAHFRGNYRTFTPSHFMRYLLLFKLHQSFYFIDNQILKLKKTHSDNQKNVNYMIR